MKIKTASDLKRAVTASGSYFFSPSTMGFFGDTMKNYYVPVEQGVARKFRVKTTRGNTHICYKLERRNPAKANQQKSTYFDCGTLDVVHGEALR